MATQTDVNLPGMEAQREATEAVASRRRNVRRWLFMVLIWLIALAWALPLLWILISSFKNQWEIPQFNWIPEAPTLDNYLNLFDPQGRAVNIVAAFANSLIVAVAATLGALFSCSCAGYAFARLKFWGRDIIFVMLLATLMIPSEIVLVPLFLQFYRLKLLNTYFALIAPHMVSILGVFLMRQFMLNIPPELEEAAAIEGAGPFTTFWRIVLPLTKPSLATLAVLVFLGSWNDFLWPLIVVNKPALNTLPLALITFRSAYGAQDYGTVLSSVMFAVIPPLIFFAFAQNLIVTSISRTGIK